MISKSNRAIFTFAVVSLFAWGALSATSANIKTPQKSVATQSTTRVQKKKEDSGPKFGAAFSVTRSTSLIDFQDGSRSDSMYYSLRPLVSFAFGTFRSELAYNQNLRDEATNTENDFNDVPLVFSFIPTLLSNDGDYSARLNYSLTGVIPVSQYSTKRDQLQTSISGRISFSISPNDSQGPSMDVGVTAGRNFHTFEEDINGRVLNQYSSNQSLILGYGFSQLSLSLEIYNRTRWTYQGNTRSSFEATEEIGYSFGENFSAAIGHTNSGATLKPNGADSNFDFFDENTSTVYGTLGVAF